MELIKEYDVQLDSKKRMTIRGNPPYKYYRVRMYGDGRIEMEPRILVEHDEEISAETLRMMDRAMENFRKGIVGSAIDFSEFPELLEEDE